jgi:hypothetical protein
MSPTPHAPAASRTVIGRALGGQPRTYRLQRPERSRSVTAACRHLAVALVGELHRVRTTRVAHATSGLAPAA